MIFVTVGTDRAPFDRLLRAVEHLQAPDTLVVQYGTSQVRPVNATCVDFLPFDDWVEHISRADTIVTHGGVGSIMVALMHGKRPFVVPRLRRFGEAVDDHQELFARRFGEAGQAVYVEDPERLADQLLMGTTTVPRTVPSPELARDLRKYLDDVIPNGRRPAR